MRRLLIFLGLVLAVAGGGFAALTRPAPLPPTALPAHRGDVANGEYMFFAAGCASCHATPKGGKCDEPQYEDARRLGGGRCLKTAFGTFIVPNISPHREAGIGRWSRLDFVNAMMRGVSPSGAHYYPAFPYTSYQRMRIEDVLDIKAFIDTLEPVPARASHHDLPLALRWRRPLGVWKELYLDGKPFEPDPTKSAEINRGAYLVLGPGHCAECHTPRTLLGGLDRSRMFAGAPSPDGRGWVPNITPHETGIGSWSKEDIAYALETGLKPDFDSFGSTMVAVQRNMAKLTAADRAAIAAYLRSLPPIPSARPPRRASAGRQ